MICAKVTIYAYQNNKVIASTPHTTYKNNHIKMDQRPKFTAEPSDKNMGSFLCNPELDMTLAVQPTKLKGGKVDLLKFKRVYNKEYYENMDPQLNELALHSH